MPFFYKLFFLTSYATQLLWIKRFIFHKQWLISSYHSHTFCLSGMLAGHMVISWAHESSQHVGISSSVCECQWSALWLQPEQQQQTATQWKTCCSANRASTPVIAGFWTKTWTGRSLSVQHNFEGKRSKKKRRNWSLRVRLSFKLQFPIPLPGWLPRPFCKLAKQANLRNNHRSGAIPTALEGSIRKWAIYV